MVVVHTAHGDLHSANTAVVSRCGIPTASTPTGSNGTHRLIDIARRAERPRHGFPPNTTWISMDHDRDFAGQWRSRRIPYTAYTAHAYILYGRTSVSTYSQVQYNRIGRTEAACEYRWSIHGKQKSASTSSNRRMRVAYAYFLECLHCMSCRHCRIVLQGAAYVILS
jgi:hypothetical protein